MTTEEVPSSRDAIYLAVLPFYRQECMKELALTAERQVTLFAGKRHVDPTIRTGIETSLYTEITNLVLGGRLLLQYGHLHEAIEARTLILDLNPRSITAWFLLVTRSVLRRRTLVWGHLHPRAGGMSRTAFLRRAMRRLASGTVLYGYDSVAPARREIENSPLWVAPNSLYRHEDVRPRSTHGVYDRILYVGRLVKEKKVDVLIRGFALTAVAAEGARLTIVGDGEAKDELQALAKSLDIAELVDFLGHEGRLPVLKELYETAICSVSPGYVGLSLTQSLGFGVPMAVSRDEPHSPELELQRYGGVHFFDTDSPASLADVIDSLPRRDAGGDRSVLSEKVMRSYSAQSMAVGLNAALNNRVQVLGADGWPAS
jgi:glycosyltransferase involved in cell wall biosynthesis